MNEGTAMKEPREPTAPLAPRDVAAALRATLAALRAETSSLPAALLCWHPAPGEWCVLEVIGHLIEAEARGFAGRVRTLLAEPDPEFRTWDQEAVARARGDCRRPPGAVLEELATSREASAALVESLRPEDLGRAGRHPDVGRLSIADLLAEWVHHDANHTRQILANVQAYVWPHMGNARRFSRPDA
jgi:DinB superfamily